MARPEEKAQAMLNKWVKMREDHEKEQSGFLGSSTKQRRPYLASQCEFLADAEKFRRDIIRDISDGIRKIQNPGLGEHAIRDLNDQINKYMREKYHWNKRIMELGGMDYNKLERRQRMEEGDVQTSGMGIQGSGGYRYFGEARNLPGVKELFARHAAKITKRKRGDIYQYITPDYYGLRDEEDGVLLELEDESSKRHQKEQSLSDVDRGNTNINDDNDDDDDDDDFLGGGIMGASDAIAAHVAVPTQELVAQIVLEKKKRELLNKLIF